MTTTVCNLPEKPGLAPIAGSDPEILILGSCPSRQSLLKGEYYGNPQNQFWKIVEMIFGIDRTLPYTARTSLLVEHRIALWDVLATCTRDGSADTAIRDPVPNDIREFLTAHPTIRCIALNGNTAGRYYARMNIGVSCTILPSTSPAYASMTLAKKAQTWACIRTRHIQ
ncbi:DNA-deoxyinosine glycosylase [Methanoregula sp.]|jgi:TDG/mug DNA glycosylase family protein|uniref:DNA-deoxyinosine glycosylase n=1 Tax=Methanoregula sp. TaxID=2052170 RepID=UPI0025F59165|nr:DNA-deoxyinosine glycosylase [Methanoregula sp.]